jgi:hypothetical protein
MSFVIPTASTITAAGVIACAAYLRGILRRLDRYESRLFRDELHLLDHERRIDALEPPKRVIA